MPKTVALDRSVFRAARGYELVRHEALSADEVDALGALTDEAEYYGLLRPTASGNGTVKTVDTDTALLLLTLQRPGPLPRFVGYRGDPEVAESRIVDLVLDGVLEIEHRGRFVVGTGALPALGLDTGAGSATRDVLGQLAHEALRTAQASALDAIEPVAALLYTHNALPLTAAWQRRLPDREAVASFLGADHGTRLTAWRANAPRGPEDWLGWTRRGNRSGGSRSRPTHKLYLSPRPDALPSVFPVWVEVLDRSRAKAFKTGGSAWGLLRSDKMVAYFDDLDAVHETAEALVDRLAGVPAQGVPFTAAISTDGLVSWGMDPPDTEAVLPWQVRESWRLWVVRRLAAFMVAGRASTGSGASQSAVEPWHFALERLRREGVDVARWQPSLDLWRRSA